MFKRIGLAILAVAMLGVTANAGILTSSWSRISFVGGGGVAIQANDDSFQDHWKDALYSTLVTEAEVYPNVSVYGSYDKQSFDPASNAGLDPIDVTSWGAGIKVFGNINSTGSARAYLDLGFSGNTETGQDKTWTFAPGGGLDFDLTSSGQAGLRLGGKWRNYDDQPEKIQAVLLQCLLRVSPGRVLQ